MVLVLLGRGVDPPRGSLRIIPQLVPRLNGKREKVVILTDDDLPGNEFTCRRQNLSLNVWWGWLPSSLVSL